MKKFLWSIMLCFLMSCQQQQSSDFCVDEALDYCSDQVNRALTSLRDSTDAYDFTMMPRNILEQDSVWNCRKACSEEWCSGFWPGILWMTFSHNHNEDVWEAAEGYTEALIPVVEAPVYDHDLGFITINSFMKGYEVTHKEHYREIALRAAESLATLFNPTVGTILSWPRHVKDYGGHNTIMDNMVNLELLFWAAREMKSEKLYHIAISHAETTMNNQFREDGSCYHVALYDTLDGHFIKGFTHQGYADSSMWSRGQSWAIYGYTMVYRYSKDARFLEFAQKVTDIYLQRLHETSDDMVPLWDMDDPRGLEAPKDASAACVVASALLELRKYVDGEKSKEYRSKAEQMLCDLSSDRYQSREKNVAFLMHSTGHHPAGSEIDASIIYADYYYLEALLRLKE